MVGSLGADHVAAEGMLAMRGPRYPITNRPEPGLLNFRALATRRHPDVRVFFTKVRFRIDVD